MPVTRAQETCTRNWYQYLAPEICMENLTQVHHSFLHKNNSPANHVARFDSRDGQFLCWNRAVRNLYQTRLTDTRTNSFWYKTTCTSFWYKLLWACVAGIRVLGWLKGSANLAEHWVVGTANHNARRPDVLSRCCGTVNWWCAAEHRYCWVVDMCKIITDALLSRHLCL